MMHGGQLIARALKAEGVDTVFALTGGHILPILDGCVLEGIRIVDVRHEQTAIHAAEAYSRITGRLGVAAVTAGPGVTDAMTGVASAFYSGAPILLLGGRHYVRQELMGGLQEMNHPLLFGSITKWSATAWETAKLPMYVATAARHAFSGRGGPVFLDVPLDVQADMVRDEGFDWPSDYRANQPRTIDQVTIVKIAEAIRQSKAPVIFAGGGYRGDHKRMLQKLAEAIHAPVYLQSTARGSVEHDFPLLGNRTRSAAFAGTDLLLAFGVDWDFRTGYGQKVNPAATVVQIDADETKIGWNRPANLGVVADPMIGAMQLAGVALGAGAAGELDPGFSSDLMAEERRRRAEAAALADNDGSPVFPERFAKEVSEFFGSDSIVAVDGGDIVSTTAKWMEIDEPGMLLDPGPFGTLGTGPPFALAAKVLHPGRRVGVVFGDGAFGFNGMEYDTFVRLGLPIIGVIGNDGAWSNIKTIHKMFFPERVVAADLGVRPYHAMVEGLGGYGEFVDDPTRIRPALERAEASGKPALVNVHIAEVPRASSNYSQ
jgi:acetolactate synthase-1/2/3 large subunit